MSDKRHYEAAFETLMEAHLPFIVRGLQGPFGRNLRNYRQIALTWRCLATRQTLSGESGAPGQIWQTLSAEFLPALSAGGEVETIFEAHLGVPGPIGLAAKEIPC